MRRCQRLGCENSLPAHARADARYCSSTCRREAHRSRAVSTDGTADPGFWSRYVQIRRRRARSRGVLGVTVGMLAVFVLAGCGGGNGQRAPYRTLPRPPLSGLHSPSSSCPHVMGGCLPRPSASGGFGLTGPRQVGGSITGPDLSNNDPVFGRSSWQQIRARSRFVYVKSVEGTGFYDQTAAGMASAAKAVGLPVGGYDFLHLCQVSAAGEASHFISALRSQGLLGAGSLPPAADVEYGSGGCGGRAWLATWIGAVYAGDGHVCPIVYTGAWFWQPNLGSYWPTCQGHGLLSWISGYAVRYPYMPSGLSHLDFWQFSDHSFNGATYADLSVWRDGEPAFAQFAHAKPPVPPLVCFGAHASARNATCVRVRHQAVGWAAARDSSQRAYTRRGCVVLAQRDRWFTSALHARPRQRVAHRRAALAATRRAERQRSCAVFAGRAGYFDQLVRRAHQTYGGAA